MLTNGPLVRELEHQATGRLGVNHVVAVSSCTVGLVLTLQTLEPSGPVLLPSFTFSAAAHAIAWNGLRPLFDECGLSSFQVDADDLARRTDGAGAILPTQVFGAPCDTERPEALARSAGVPLVLDAAHALGASYNGRPVGNFGAAEVFSLSPTKLAVGGEGGLVATADATLAARLRIARDYFFPPVHRQQAYAHLELAHLPVTDDVARRVVSLSIFARLAPGAVDQVVEVLAGSHAPADEVAALP